ncbi:MAG: hypothetical protein ABI680_16485, partial [Chthoniobacteraceae bacterium]
MKNKASILLAAAGVLLLIAVILAWPDARPPEPADPPALAVAEPPPEIRIQEEIDQRVGFDPPDPPTPAEMAAADALTIEMPDPISGETLLPSLPLQAGELPWETTLRQVIATPGLTDSQIGKRLLDLLPALPVQAREAATEEAITRISNADYSLVIPTLTNPQTHSLTHAVLLTDLMERPDSIRLPTLLRIARTPQHPLAAHALDDLDGLLGQNFGTDWGRWDAAIRADLA